MNNSSNYLVQILEQQQETLKHIKDHNQQASGQAAGTSTLYMPQKAVPQHAKGTIYQVTAPRGTMLSQLSEAKHGGAVFRPVSPSYNHHIYMEIDPVYAQAVDGQHNEFNYQSDIQLSDISDDDLRRFSDTSSRATQYGEERPLIRASFHQQQQQVNNNNLMRQSLIAAQNQQMQRNCMTTNRMRSIGPLQVATLNNQQHVATLNTQSSLRGLNRLRQQQQQHAIYAPNPIHSANPSLVSAASVGLEGPVAIALQGGEQFVSLQIDQQHIQ